MRVIIHYIRYERALSSSVDIPLAIGIITAAPVMGIASCPSLFSRF